MFLCSNGLTNDEFKTIPGQVSNTLSYTRVKNLQKCQQNLSEIHRKNNLPKNSTKKNVKRMNDSMKKNSKYRFIVPFFVCK